MPSRSVARIVWIPAMLLCVTQGVIYYKKPPALFAPAAELKAFSTRDKTISLMRPANWKGSATSNHAVETEVRFTPSLTSEFVVTIDLMGSLIADASRAGANLPGMENLPGMGQMNAGGQNPDGGKQKTPLETVHALQKMQLEKEKEEMKDGKATPTQLSGLEAIRSDFTSEKGQTIGRRYSALSQEGRISLYCLCSKDEAKYIMPAFEKMIKSLKIGARGGM